MKPLLYFMLLLVCACSKNEELVSNNCGYTKKEVRLIKKITKYTDFFNNRELTENFFYDKMGRLDSVYIEKKDMFSPSTILYGNSYIRYIYGELNQLKAERHYDSGTNSISYYNYYYDLAGKLSRQTIEGANYIKTIEIAFVTDDLGRISSSKQDKDKEVFTHDECGNCTSYKVYNENEKYEEYHEVSEYSNVYNPLYFKKMPNAETSKNPHLSASMALITCEACKGLWKYEFEHHTNSLNLPVKTMQYYEGKVVSVTEYIYN